MKCIDEEIPFEIPQGWEWERIGNVFFVTKLAGFEYTKFFTKEALSASNPIPIVRAQNVRMGFFEENKNEAIGKSSVSCPLKPSDSAPLKHSTMPP